MQRYVLQVRTYIKTKLYKCNRNNNVLPSRSSLCQDVTKCLLVTNIISHVTACDAVSHRQLEIKIFFGLILLESVAIFLEFLKKKCKIIEMKFTCSPYAALLNIAQLVLQYKLYSDTFIDVDILVNVCVCFTQEPRAALKGLSAYAENKTAHCQTELNDCVVLPQNLRCSPQKFSYQTKLELLLQCMDGCTFQCSKH